VLAGFYDRAHGRKLTKQRPSHGRGERDLASSGHERLKDEDGGAGGEQGAWISLNLEEASRRGGSKDGAGGGGGPHHAAELGLGTDWTDLGGDSRQGEVAPGLGPEDNGADLGGAGLGSVGVALASEGAGGKEEGEEAGCHGLLDKGLLETAAEGLLEAGAGAEGLET
jgi:hypothetical protein